MSNLDLQSIAYQTDRKFFTELTAALEPICRKGLGERALKAAVQKAGIEKIIKRYTNIKSSVGVYAGAPNAFVYPMIQLRNNPLVYDHWKKFIDNRDVRKLTDVIKNKEINVGYVDLKNARVHGIYSEIETPIYISTGAANFFYPENLAAVLLHEIGHGFTFMQMASTMLLRNYALSAIADEIIKQDDPQHRTILLKDVNEAFKYGKMTDKQIKELEQAKKAGEIHFALLNADIINTRGETGCDFYELISAEYLADQFAARMGASAALTDAMDTIYKAYGAPETYGTAGRFCLHILEIIHFIVFAIATFGIGPILIGLIIIIFGLNPQSDIYDKPVDRILRIRQQLVGELKLINDVEMKKQILDELKRIDEVVASLKPYMSIIDKLWVTLVPSFKKDINDKQIQKQIENIAYNDIFIHAQKLSTLS